MALPTCSPPYSPCSTPPREVPLNLYGGGHKRRAPNRLAVRRSIRVGTEWGHSWNSTVTGLGASVSSHTALAYAHTCWVSSTGKEGRSTAGA